MTLLFDEKRLQELHDQAMRREYLAEGRAKGRAEGRVEGRTEGRAEGRTEGIELCANNIAREMLLEKMPVSTIARLTKLSEEAIGNLARTLGVTPVA